MCGADCLSDSFTWHCDIWQGSSPSWWANTPKRSERARAGLDTNHYAFPAGRSPGCGLRNSAPSPKRDLDYGASLQMVWDLRFSHQPYLGLCCGRHAPCELSGLPRLAEGSKVTIIGRGGEGKRLNPHFIQAMNKGPILVELSAVLADMLFGLLNPLEVEVFFFGRSRWRGRTHFCCPSLAIPPQEKCIYLLPFLCKCPK